MNTARDSAILGTKSVTSEQDCRYDEARRIFPESTIQFLNRESAIRCQTLLGHGDQFGVWKTPKSLVSHLKKGLRSIDLHQRLTNFLPDDIARSARLDACINEGVLWLTRYSLLQRLGPVGIGLSKKRRPLDASTVVKMLYHYVPSILARCIARRIEGADIDDAVFVRCLKPDDLRSLRGVKHSRIELDRMCALSDMALWSDAPAKPDIKQITSPKGDATMRPPEASGTPFLPIPDDYLAEMGPRVLWLVQDLGPNLLHLFDAIPDLFGDLEYQQNKNHMKAMQIRLCRYFAKTTWFDRHGQPIVTPPFSIKIGAGRGVYKTKDPKKSDPYAWPPRNWGHIQSLAVVLQSSHMWVALLAMAGRVSEVMTLTRDCIEWARDENFYVNGKTYKLSRNLAGEAREWPAPDVLVDALAQQVRLVNAWERIACHTKGRGEVGETLMDDADHLWASLGTARTANPEAELASPGKALEVLALRLGLTPRPGGKNLHPHRFRKTAARLAGLAIVDSPRVLMQLLGHRDITMTLHYILTDKGLQAEIEQVARELRIMRYKDLVEDLHSAVHTPGSQSFGGHGGSGARVLTEAVKTHEVELHRMGREWGADSAYELAVILSNNGQYFRVARPGVICTKAPSEIGLCSHKLGDPNTGNCQPGCNNRIEDKLARRDVIEIIPILLREGRQALAENQLLVVAEKVRQVDEELARFDDIGAEWGFIPEVIALRDAVA
jgi:hypothetical protein